jgi:hypothetical protein
MHPRPDPRNRLVLHAAAIAAVVSLLFYLPVYFVFSTPCVLQMGKPVRGKARE